MNGILIALLTFLLTVTAALAGQLYRETRDRLRKLEAQGDLRDSLEAIEQRLEKIEVRQANTVRAMFLLMSRLHPDKGAVVTEVMQDLLANGKAAHV